MKWLTVDALDRMKALFPDAPAPWIDLSTGMRSHLAFPCCRDLATPSTISRFPNRPHTRIAVLDIGCATGTQCDVYDQVKHVTGIDISSKLLAVAEQRMQERGINNVRVQTDGAFR